MINLRKFVAGAALAIMIGSTMAATPAAANVSQSRTTAPGGAVVEFATDVEPGAIVISASQRRLFYVVGNGVAISYPVAVPKRGKEWSGVTSISSKHVNPDWTPPAAVKADHPELPDLIPGGAPNNPMGTRAMLLDRGEVAIHGTTTKMRASVGTAASYGCIRMRNEDVADLFDRVSVGATVIMQP
ncbi:L,D-transpeptidase [Methylocystis sp. WRRC1]|uniref:L,D-transpeptidase n=1 Tax=Methylocystis sp. WRRC1 TaxID=1732014 RepID=UPI001D159763|nr:L,D-transpeptidase [Methylocystis sp. WRRC1]MCC3246269.1 L,D-transpeptidase [Methylocystis sp. WRRC1]